MWIEKNGKTWRIRDERGGRKITVESGYPTKTAARNAKRILEGQRLQGDYLDPSAGRILLSEWVQAWWPTYEVSLKPSARHSEGSRLRNHILPLLGHLTFEELDSLVAQRWVAQLLAGTGDMPAQADARRRRGEFRRRPLSVKTVRNCHGLLHRILDAAVQARRIRVNPCVTTALPKRVRKEMRFLTEPEIGRLVASVPAHWKPLVLLLVATGLRWGEAAGLRVMDVDVIACRLTVTRTMHEMSGTSEIVFTEPKTERSRRSLRFPKVVGMALAPLVVGKGREDLVFTAPMGGEARARNFRRGWLKWLAAAGLDGLRIHDLRHTHAAILISQAVPLTAIQQRMGHSSIAVTSDLYGHLMPVVDEGILLAVDAALLHTDLGQLAAEVELEMLGAE